MPTLEFKGKQFVYSHHLSVPFRELQVVPDKSLPVEGKQPSLDDNLIIHGDNLEALKALLPTHAGKVDCIFIDPPYNTGNEGWCYNDNVRSPLMKEWLKKSANPVDKEDLERHEKWLCMMWPRLNLLKELLSPTGVIFATIDDNEGHRLRGLLDEIFGEEQHVATIVWQKRYSRENREAIGDVHDYVHVYAMDKGHFKATRNKLDPTEDQLEVYRNPNNDPKGRWRPVPITAQAGHATKDQFYEITTPSGKVHTPPEGRCWGMSENTFNKLQAEGRIYFGKKGDAQPNLIRYASEIEGFVPWTWWPSNEAGHTDEAKKELMSIMKDSELAFDTIKPVRLLHRILQMATHRDSLILDSFAGSGSTAHAVLELNKYDQGDRRFILVECEDYADSLTAERVRRVIKGYPYTGTLREELHRENITWSTFEKKQAKVLEHIASIENLNGHEYDKIKKQIKDGILTVTGERKVKETAPGIGGSFTYCTLGEPIDIESLLTGKGLPGFDALARYVFYTATGQSLEKIGKPAPDGFIGETDLFRVHLFYQPNKEWLRSNDSALNAERMAAIGQGNKSGKRAIVFAVAKFMSQKELTARRIEFCQLPYAVHRILGG
ncbi:adenine-specific DNA-methyltransferase [Marinobacter sp. LV10R510-11A]|uniref:site-specific DNA-methyltransferase n=1 Tax=Marinobacter sp. LV10R510-11A TaxID=1415568 RepID=UPI000BB918D4|nr:site-specific DNA-methyltransferase [Marinobacter sp. LV10R510-11A]SOB76015.1 adenine-specific DNA-methyltransferase [Marinobacter sp. LV10R510-11A]